MESFEDLICELELNEIDPLNNLTLQDSLIVVAVYVNAMLANLGRNKNGIHRIKSLAGKHPLFREKSEVILSRIYKYTNLLKTRDRCTAVGSAAESLTPRLRKTAFEWALHLVIDNGILTKEARTILAELRKLLSIDRQVAQNIIDKITGPSKNLIG